jgi:hypothetical protein
MLINNKIIIMALEFGCKTAKDFSKFIQEYQPIIIKNAFGQEEIHFALLR